MKNVLNWFINRFLSSLPGPVSLIAHNGIKFDFPLLRNEMKKARWVHNKWKCRVSNYSRHLKQFCAWWINEYFLLKLIETLTYKHISYWLVIIRLFGLIYVYDIHVLLCSVCPWPPTSFALTASYSSEAFTKMTRQGYIIYICINHPIFIYLWWLKN